MAAINSLIYIDETRCITTNAFDILAEKGSGKNIVMVGPTSPLSPILFDYGVDVIGGSNVVDPEKTIRSISEGVPY